MNVVFLAPSYPAEMPLFTRGLAEVGANVWGVGDQPLRSIPLSTRRYFHDYLQVPSLFDEVDVMHRVRHWLLGRSPDRIEALWEPMVMLAARLRAQHGVPGMSVDTVRAFRDKGLMKARIAAAGLRVPRARRVKTTKETWAAAEEIGFPLILKPIAGAGSADTYRVDSAARLKEVLAQMGHVQEASCEEFVEGEEFTYDTICIDGKPAYENVAQYLPRPLVARSEEWISPVIITVRDMYSAKYDAGLRLGRGVLQALGMGTGFTHMEWYLKQNGEVVFGEIGCRVGGARLVDQMNYTSNVDLFREWARAVCWKDCRANVPRTYNTAIIFKRAIGEGVITRIDGLDAYKHRFHSHLCGEELLRPGQHRRDWKKTLLSDGWLMVRHPDFEEAKRIAGAAATDIRLYAH